MLPKGSVVRIRFRHLVIGLGSCLVADAARATVLDYNVVLNAADMA
jgi:hypothetical protein